MLLYVTGPEECDETRALELYAALARAFPELAKACAHPRGGAPCEPAITRLDHFLGAFSPAPAASASGLRIALPPVPQAPLWGLGMRPALRELVVTTFPQTPRYLAAMDPVGPLTDRPTAAPLPPLTDLATSLAGQPDPAQKPVDPRLWLVLAPPMPEVLELMFLPTFLRAEPWARVARAPANADAAWLEREIAALARGEGLATRGLVTNLEDATHTRVIYKDDAGAERAHVVMIEGTTALEESYAWRVTIAAGQTYARLHSHSGSEELYVVHSGAGLIRVNERLIPIKTGDVFGKPRGYDCATQIVNPGPEPLVLFDFGTLHRTEVDLCRYPEHGELLSRFGGHTWVVPTDALRPRSDFSPVYDRRYVRTSRRSE